MGEPVAKSTGFWGTIPLTIAILLAVCHCDVEGHEVDVGPDILSKEEAALILEDMPHGDKEVLFLGIISTRLAALRKSTRRIDIKFAHRSDTVPTSIRWLRHRADIAQRLEKLSHSKGKSFYTPVALIGIFLGLIGNFGFAHFFANRKYSRIYRTRDALYFRWMLVFDLLMCIIVMPYSIAFEMGAVQDRTTCKLMEYFRHFLIYVSHMFLVIYSYEFSRRTTYELGKSYMKRLLRALIPLGLIFASPTLIIFMVDPEDLHITEYYITNSTEVRSISHHGLDDLLAPVQASTSPKKLHFAQLGFCHLSLNFNKKKENYETVRMVKTIYLCANIGLYVIALIIYVSGIIQFLDSKPYLGRDSLFVDMYEKRNPYIKDRVQAYTDELERKKAGKKKKRSQRKMSLEMHSDITNTSVSKSILKKTTRYAPPKIQRADSSGTDLDRVYTHVHFVEPESSQELSLNQNSVAGQNVGMSTKITSSGVTEGSGSKRAHHVIQVESPAEEAEAETAVDPLGVVHLPRTDSVELVLLSGTVHVLEHEASTGERERKQHLRPTSFTQSMMLLIFLDLFVITITCILYIALGERSKVLNLVHLKSVFSFYIMSLSNKQLRKAVWTQPWNYTTGRCCYGEAKDDSPTQNLDI